MDSPDRSPKTVKVTDMQGSPFFTYLCSLSPIQPVKSVHVAQTFSELSFPPPPAVFVSPRVDQKSTACLRRVFSDSKAELFKVAVDHQTENARARKQKNGIGNGVASFSRVKIHSSSPCNNSTKCDQDLIEQYLTDPVETGLYNSVYQQEGTDLAHFDTDQSNMHVTINESEKCEISALPTSRVLEAKNDTNCLELHSKEPVECQLPVKLDAMNDKLHEMLEIAGRMKVETSLTREDQAEKVVNPSSDLSVQELVLMENRDLDQLLGIDESASDFPFLLSGASDELPRQNDSAQVLCKQSLGLLKPEKEEIIIGDIEGREKDLELSEDCKVQLVLEAKEEKEAEASMDDLAAADIRPSNANYRGIRRRCLDFQTIEEQKNRLGNFSLRNSSAGQISSKKSGAMSGIVAIRQYQHGLEKKPSVSSTSKIEAGGLVLSPDMPIPNSQQLGESGQERPDSDHFGSSQISIGMPLGFGLHLNSLTGALTQTRDDATSSATNIPTSSISACSIPTVGPLHCQNELASETFQNTLSANSEPGMAISLAEKARMEKPKMELENEAVTLIANMTTIGCHSFSLEDMTTEDMVLLGGGDDDQKISPIGRKRVLLQEFCQQGDSDAQDDSGQSPPSPRKKRKSGSAGDGCKRCSCKKSKCLKLYCDCFAAGVYCADPCSCHDCFNKPEFEDTVLGTRQQIESRNPLAFAPKIVRAADSSLINGDENGETPASARHKRGCNCKKSMCLKKYCECYQAGVGCSDGCRCKKCKNIYGRKEVSEEFDDETPQAELADKEFTENKPDFGIGLVVPDSCRNNELSPLTPFQPLGHSGSSEKLISSRKRQLTGEDFISPILSQSQSPSSGILCSSNRSFISTMTPLVHTQMSSMKTTPMAASSALKVSRFGQFSPGWDGLGDICTLTPLPQAPGRPTPASSSIQDRIDSSPCFSHQTD